MSILVINNYKDYNYSEILSERKSELVVLSSHELDDYKEFKYFEHIPNIVDTSYTELRAVELHEKYNFSAVVAEFEFDLLLAGRIRTRLGIHGQSEESALAFRDKVVMKNYLATSSLILPAYQRLITFRDVEKFIEIHEYPVVIKPVDSAASINVNIIHNKEDLIQFSKENWQNNLMIEKFIEGDMFHIDALIENNNEVVLSVSKYVNGCLGYSKLQSLGSFQLSPNDSMYIRLRNYFYQVLDKLPTPETSAYHLEVFYTEDDKLVFCEIASRVGGAFVTESVLQTYSVHLCDYWLRSISNITTPRPNGQEAPPFLSGWLLVPPQKGKLLSIPETVPFEWVTKYEKSGVLNKEYNNPSRSVDRIASFLLKDTSSEGLRRKIEELDTWFRDNTIWEEESVKQKRETLAK